KAIDDVGGDEDFKGGSWVSTVEFVNANGGGIMNGCLGDIENYLKNGKLEKVVGYGKNINVGSFPSGYSSGNGSGIDEEALNLALEEEARAEHEWLEKCRQEQELDEEHERHL
ncbi:hypothetical protein Tco_1060857, partial [Tanacetum coccineum]